ncbi:MAG: nickel pincer cofactor biosynthesis protein LarC [Actinomycetota bacterium]
MSRVAWFNCAAGTAGDMTMAALVDAGADQVRVGEILAALDVHDYALTFERTQRCGVGAVRALVAVHEHDDDHGHHRSWRSIDSLLNAADLPDRVRARARAVFATLAEVEAAIHGVPVDDVEFHEVGSTDAIVDIVGACAALESLGLDRIVAGPIAMGHGSVESAHGTLPNPAPAVLALCARRSVPTVGLDDHRELSTPTGVAFLVALADEFAPLPALRVESVGYGAGARDLPTRANVVQVVVGQSIESSIDDTGQAVRLLEVNVDDVTGEVLAHTVSSLLAAGAHDAWITPIIMKKGRPAHTVHALCDESRASELAALLVRETGSLGVRASSMRRWPHARRETTVEVDGHTIRVKIADHRIKVEFDDAARAADALGLPVREVLRRAEESAR